MYSIYSVCLIYSLSFGSTCFSLLSLVGSIYLFCSLYSCCIIVVPCLVWSLYGSTFL